MSDPVVAVDRAARMFIRKPLKDHQRDAIRVLRAPDARRVVVLMPRQTGKTTLLWLDRMATLFEPSIMRPGYQSCYAAQSGKIVTDRFSMPGGWISLVERSRVARDAKCFRTRGGELISHRHSLAFLAALPPTSGAARSAAYDSAILDECQQHTHEYGAILEGDLSPTQQTRPHAQIVYAGTANYEGSWWHEKVQAGRDGKIILYEVGTWPDDADPADPATWWAHHPGLRSGMTTEQFMADELATLGVDTFAREYGNKFAKQSTTAVLDVAAWARCARTSTPDQPRRGLYVAYDASWDRSSAAVVAAWMVGDVTQVEVVAHRPGTAWLTDYVADLYRRRRPTLLTDTATPAKDTTRALQARKVPVTELGTPDYTAACAELATAVTQETIRHPDDPALTTAVQSARSRPVGDRWLFDRRTAHDLSPLTATAVAHWHARRPVAPPLLV